MTTTSSWDDHIARCQVEAEEIEWEGMPPERIQWICEDATLELVSYPTYLKTSIWKMIRDKALDHYGNSCVLCGHTPRVDVHHRRYPPRGTETPADLIVLCRRCHQTFHDTLAP